MRTPKKKEISTEAMEVKRISEQLTSLSYDKLMYVAGAITALAAISQATPAATFQRVTLEGKKILNKEENVVKTLEEYRKALEDVGDITRERILAEADKHLNASDLARLVRIAEAMRG